MSIQFMTAQTTKNISLHEAVTLGLSSNPIILQSRHEVKSARGKILQAGKIQNPEIGFTLNEVPSGYKFGSANEKDISISQFFEYPTKRSNRISSASFDEQIAIAGVEQAKVLVTNSIRKAYINAQYSREVVRNIEKQLMMFSDFQSTITDKYKTGEAKYFDVVRIEIETARLHNDLLEAKNNDIRMQSALKNSIGDSSATYYIPQDSLVFQPIIVNKDSVIDVLIRQSNILKMKRLQIEKKESNVTLAKSSYYPDYGVGLAYQRRTPSSSFLGVEFKVAVPLWFWQEPQGLVEDAIAQLSIAEVQLRAVEYKIRNNLKSAYASVQSAGRQMKNIEQILKKGLSEMQSVALSQYRNNQIDLLNLFDVYRSVRTMQEEYIRSVANYENALAELEVAAELITD
jgi:cobalt-zinc-cadmium efflux system outer membrane protein